MEVSKDAAVNFDRIGHGRGSACITRLRSRPSPPFLPLTHPRGPPSSAAHTRPKPGGSRRGSRRRKHACGPGRRYGSLGPGHRGCSLAGGVCGVSTMSTFISRACSAGRQQSRRSVLSSTERARASNWGAYAASQRPLRALLLLLCSVPPRHLCLSLRPREPPRPLTGLGERLVLAVPVAASWTTTHLVGILDWLLVVVGGLIWPGGDRTQRPQASQRQQ